MKRFVISIFSPDKAFLHPKKLSTKKKRNFIKIGTDTALIFFTGANHQPVFTDKTNNINFAFNIESILFKSSSGNILNGWLIKPKELNVNITLLHFHGCSGNILTNFEFIAPLIEKGFQLFIFDYSGFGFSSGSATRQNTLKDALSALEYLKSRIDIQNTKLVIYGQSYGGHLSAVIAAMKQNDIDGLVIEGAFSSHHDAMNGFWGWIGRQVTDELYCAKESIVKYHKSLLVIHSTEDQIVPTSMGRTIFNQANQPKCFYEINGCHIHGPKLYAESISEKIKNMVTT